MESAREQEWVRQARTGNRDAFAGLVDLYWERIRRWLFHLTHQAHLAEDLTQDVFFKAWTSLPELHEETRFRAWLFRIARNRALDSQRGPRGQPCQPLTDTLPTAAAGPLQNLLDQEAQQRVQAACARLPLAYRAAYLLWTQEELPYAEIAQVLGITEETARWRVCKARQLLLKELEIYLVR